MATEKCQQCKKRLSRLLIEAGFLNPVLRKYKSDFSQKASTAQKRMFSAVNVHPRQVWFAVALNHAIKFPSIAFIEACVIRIQI